MQNEQIIMELITYSGDARSKALMALSSVKENDFDEAERLLKEANNDLLSAHQVQTKLLWEECNGEVEEKIDFSLLLVHAQDHMMNAMTIYELVEQLVELFRERWEKDND